ncbi:hypothetical protein GQ53DRAFT_825846 [Thozetella sp. PMI_491]|nr:hypothetical protein GQ53DRAFT_825846 [Thozetella sp. PMI_491]
MKSTTLLYSTLTGSLAVAQELCPTITRSVPCSTCRMIYACPMRTLTPVNVPCGCPRTLPTHTASQACVEGTNCAGAFCGGEYTPVFEACSSTGSLGCAISTKTVTVSVVPTTLVTSSRPIISLPPITPTPIPFPPAHFSRIEVPEASA